MTESRTYDVSAFDSLIVTTGVRAIVTVGGPHAVRVEAKDAALLEKLEVTVVGGRLQVGFARSFTDFIFGGALLDLLRLGGEFSVTAYITLPILTGVEANSGARVEASNVRTDRLDVHAASGGGVALMAISSRELRAHASSGGRIDVDGVTIAFDASAASGGNLRAEKLESEHARLDASSGGHLEANVLKRVRATASSGGHISVYGAPAEREVYNSSGGHVAIKA